MGEDIVKKLMNIQVLGGSVAFDCKSFDSCVHTLGVEKRGLPLDITYSEKEEKYLGNCICGKDIDSCNILLGIVRQIDLHVGFC